MYLLNEIEESILQKGVMVMNKIKNLENPYMSISLENLTFNIRFIFISNKIQTKKQLAH